MRSLIAALAVLTFSASSASASPQTQVPRETIRVHMSGSHQSLQILSAHRTGEAWQARQEPVRETSYWLHSVDERGRTLARVSFEMPPPNHSVWVHMEGPTGGNRQGLLVIGEIPDDGAAIAEVRIERQQNARVERIGTIFPAGLSAGHPEGGLAVTDQWVTGPNSNRFDIAILAEGYLAGEESVFDTDVSELVSYLLNTEPYKQYQGYLNIRSVFRSSPNRVCINPPQPTAYGVRFVPDNFQQCGNINPMGFGGSTALNLPLADSDGMCAGYDPGGLIVLINSWPISNEIIYGGMGQPNGYALATTNRTVRPEFQSFSNSLKFPELVVHELGHSIATLADETSTLGACMGCPPPEPAANDFIEFNTSRFFDQRRWVALLSKLPPTGFPGGGGCDGSCVGVCSIFNATCLPPGPGQVWPIYHPNSACMMNLLNAPYCAPCMEELTLALHSQAGIDPVDDPIPASTSVAMTIADSVTFSFEDGTFSGSKTGTWFIDGQQQPGTGLSRTVTGVFFGLGASTISVTVADSTLTFLANPNSWLVGGIRRDQLTGTRTWNVQVTNGEPPGTLIHEITGSQGPFLNQLGRVVNRADDMNNDGVPDVAVSTTDGVHIVSGKTGTNLMFVDTPNSYEFVISELEDLDLDGRSEIMFYSLFPNFLKVKAFDFPGTQTAQFFTTNHARDLEPLGDINGDSSPDFVSVGYDRIEVISGQGPRLYLLQDPNWQTSLIGVDEGGHVAASLGYDDFNGDGRPDGDMDFDGVAEYVVSVERERTLGLERWIRQYSGQFTTGSAPGWRWEVRIMPDGEEYFVATVGDTDADGYSDFLVAAPELDISGRVDAGRVELRSGFDGTLLRTHPGGTSNENLGRGITGLGDVDLDGVPDYAIGRQATGNVQYVDVHSGASGTRISSFTNLRSNTRYGFGIAIDGIGDVNDDGIPDMAVGDRYEGSEGKLRVYSPRQSTFSATPSTIPAAGGTQTYTIDLPDSFAGSGYFLVGSVSGTAIPGIPLQGFRLPLVFDGTSLLGAQQAFIYTASVGTLDSNGNASASMTMPAYLANVLTGLRMHHAVVTTDPSNPGMANGMSNAVWVDFVP